jgi:hypothetical protein
MYIRKHKKVKKVGLSGIDGISHCRLSSHESPMPRHHTLTLKKVNIFNAMTLSEL